MRRECRGNENETNILLVLVLVLVLEFAVFDYENEDDDEDDCLRVFSFRCCQPDGADGERTNVIR